MAVKLDTSTTCDRCSRKSLCYHYFTLNNDITNLLDQDKNSTFAQSWLASDSSEFTLVMSKCRLMKPIDAKFSMYENLQCATLNDAYSFIEQNKETIYAGLKVNVIETGKTYQLSNDMELNNLERYSNCEKCNFKDYCMNEDNMAIFNDFKNRLMFPKNATYQFILNIICKSYEEDDDDGNV